MRSRIIVNKPIASSDPAVIKQIKLSAVWDEHYEPRVIVDQSASDYSEHPNGCPHCGSYEGDYNECPECGHGQ